MKKTKEQPKETVNLNDPQPTPEEIEQQKKRDRLNRMLTTTKQGSGSGEGETTGGGDQGDPNGDPLSLIGQEMAMAIMANTG